MGEPFLEVELDEEAEAGSQTNVKKQESVEKDQKIDISIKSDEKRIDIGENKFLATPAVRNLLKMHNLDPKKITGTGKSGRILKEDVLNYMNKPKGSEEKASIKEKKQEKK